MQVVTNDIGEVVLRELKKAAKVQLAVAYFSPSPNVMAALSAVPKVELVISGEFTVNNPYKLEKVQNKWEILCVEPEDEGKLHAKVLIVTRRNGSSWVLLGSANVTYSGLFTNQEACVSMESGVDDEAIQQLMEWFNDVFQNAVEVDFELAKQTFDARAAYRLERRSAKPKKEGIRYWALKTTSGKTGESYWKPLFKPENVIAIGWPGIKVDPSKVSKDELFDALVSVYPEEKPVAADTIKKFIGMEEEDLVIICRGYMSSGFKPVMIYGLARVTGPFESSRMKGQHWRFRHSAAIQVLEVELPRDVVATALQKETLMKTIHELTREEYEGLIEVLRSEGLQPTI